MKTKYLVGLIALVMLVLATAPVMADTAAATTVSGTIPQSLSIAVNTDSIAFSPFIVGDNIKENAVTVTVTAQWTGWKVATTTSPNNDGWMYLNGVPGTYLASPLERDGGTWVNVKTFAPTGTAASSMTSYPFVERFNQPVAITDKPGSYSTTITYTVTAV